MQASGEGSLLDCCFHGRRKGIWLGHGSICTRGKMRAYQRTTRLHRGAKANNTSSSRGVCLEGEGIRFTVGDTTSLTVGGPLARQQLHFQFPANNNDKRIHLHRGRAPAASGMGKIAV